MHLCRGRVQLGGWVKRGWWGAATHNGWVEPWSEGVGLFHLVGEVGWSHTWWAGLGKGISVPRG